MKIEHLSPSRIETFDQCQLKYHAIYEENLKDSPHPLTVMGKSVHKGAEDGTRAIVQGASGADFAGLVKRACVSMGVSKSNSELAVELMENALKWGYLRKVGNCVGVETEFYLDLPDGTKVKGIMDRVDILPDFLDVIDIKTQKRLIEGPIERKWQSVAYNWAARKKFDFHGIVRMSYWVLRHWVQRCWMTEDDARRGEEMLMEKAEEIRSCDDPRPSPSALCQWCPKRTGCPDSKMGVKQRFKRMK